MKIFITAILIITSGQAFASDLELVNTPDLDAAVERIYDMGRHDADSGGIKKIKVYKNTGSLSTFSIVKEVMKQDKITKEVCSEFGKKATNKCVRKVVSRNDDVMANFQVSDAMEWLYVLRSWDLSEV